jgi:hypothetical protein
MAAGQAVQAEKTTPAEDENLKVIPTEATVRLPHVLVMLSKEKTSS